jgi:aldose 1-epimerase
VKKICLLLVLCLLLSGCAGATNPNDTTPSTDLPGVQLYTACATGGFKGKKNYVNHCALCLETQGYPNSPNCPTYPSTELKAGDTYHEITVYKFSVR